MLISDKFPLLPPLTSSLQMLPHLLPPDLNGVAHTYSLNSAPPLSCINKHLLPIDKGLREVETFQCVPLYLCVPIIYKELLSLFTGKCYLFHYCFLYIFTFVIFLSVWFVFLFIHVFPSSRYVIYIIILYMVCSFPLYST